MSGVRSTLFRERRVAARTGGVSGVRSTLFRERRVAAAMFRERALLHCTTCLLHQFP